MRTSSLPDRSLELTEDAGPPPGAARFLTAEWLKLVLLNFEIEPRVLAPLVPRGTELDPWQGRTMISLVAFVFRNTRLWGIPIPFHRNFEEVNLRFYVRRRVGTRWRRGVVFIKELVPRRAVSWTARTFYGENYATVPMGHSFETIDPDNTMHVDGGTSGAASTQRVGYWWQSAGRRHHIEISTRGQADLPSEGGAEEFITEHYWGYSGGADRPTIEYRVDHPRWKVWLAEQASFDGDVSSLYGQPFVESLSAPPASALLADGSAVTVYRGAKLSGRPD